MSRALSRRLPLQVLLLAGAFLMVLAPSTRAVAAPALSAPSAILIDESTGQYLYGRAPNSRRAIASTTKLMTALLTVEHVPLGRVFAQNGYSPASADSQIGLAPGERMSVHDLLVALMLPSADDAAEDLAYNVGNGSVGRFVGMMNARARQLRLNHTHYSTPSGLDNPGNYSSAADLVTLARYLVTHNGFIKRVVSRSSAVLRTGNSARLVTNTNDILGHHHVNGIKTGHTLDAGYVLVGSATRGNMTLISAVMGTASEADRDSDTLALLLYGFRQFKLVTPLPAGKVLARPTIRYRPGARAKLIVGTAYSRVIPRSAHTSIRVKAPAQVSGPLKRHAAVGFVRVYVNGREVARVPLLLAHALPAVSPLTVAASFLTRGSTLVLLALILIAVMARRGIVRGRRRERKRAGPLQA